MKLSEHKQMMDYATERGPFKGVIGKGGRIGFKDGLSVDLYNSLYDKYAELIEQGIKNENLIDIPSWDKYIKSKNVSPVSLKYYAGGEGIRINPTELLQNKKIELAEKIIERENEKLDGAFKRGKNPPKGKLHVAELFRNKVVGPSWSLGGKHKGMNTLLNNLINTKLDTRAKKIEKAFNLVTSPEYELSNGIRNEIAELMGESKDMFDAGKLKSPYGPNPNEVWEELIKPYEYVDEKTGKTKNLLKTLNLKINKLPKGTDTTFSYLLEVVENDRLGKAGIEDWWKMAGDKPEQWAMRQIDRAWKNNDPRLKVYDLNGKPITWEAGKKISSDKILFEYVDEDFPQYKNKLYSFYKPKKTTGLNYPVYDLSTQIRTLPEWEELVEVVDGKNKLKTTEMINPFTGDKSTYQKVYEDIYKRINTTAYGTKEGYSKIKSMAGQIDHDFGQAKGLFNNFRLSTGQQNLMFKTLADAAATNPDLEPYVRALESEMYTGGSIDDQIKAIVNETNELGKVVKNAPGKITLPTATETAAYKFLQNKIPGLPEEVINYLKPKSVVVEEAIKNNPGLKRYIDMVRINFDDDQKTILKKINDAPIPNRAKALILPIVAGTAAITGADLMTGSVKAAEPGQMPQGSPGQLSEDEEGLSLQDKAAIGTVAVAGAKPAWQVGKGALKPIASPTSSALFSASNVFESINPFNEKFGKVKEDPNLTLAGIDLMIPDLVKRAGGKFATVQNVWSQIKNLGIPMKYAPFIIKRMTGLGIALTGADVALGAKKFADQLDFDRPLTEEQRTDIQERKTAVPRMFDTYEQASKIAKEQGISYEDALKQLDTPNVPGINFNQGARVNFDGGGDALTRFKNEIVNSMKPYAPGIPEDRLWLIVKDITLDMTGEEAQRSAIGNFNKYFGSYAVGGRVGYKDGSDPNRIKLLKFIRNNIFKKVRDD